MKHRDFLKPHEAELIAAVEHHYRSARETYFYTKELIAGRCKKRAYAQRKNEAA